MKIFLAALVSFCLFSVTMSAMNEVETYQRRHELGAANSIKGHILRAQGSNDQQARYSPQLEAEEGRGKPLLYLISHRGKDRQWVKDSDYEKQFREQGYIIEASCVSP